MAPTWPPLVALTDIGTGRAMDVEEWLVLPEDESGELVNGRLVEEEAPDAVRELAVSWFIRVLGTWLGQAGFVSASELKTLTGASTGRCGSGRESVNGLTVHAIHGLTPDPGRTQT